MALGVQFHEDEDLRPRMSGPRKITKQNTFLMIGAALIIIGGALYLLSQSVLNEPKLGPDVLVPGEHVPINRSI